MTPLKLPFQYNNKIVVDMNVQGILFLQQSKPSEAISWFQRGLVTLLESIDKESTGAGSNGELISCDKAFSCQHVIGDRETLQESGILCSIALPGCVSAVNDDVFVLFNRALHLPSEVDEMMARSNFYHHLLSVVLTYNIGLAHHLAGLHNGSTPLLSRGFDFYSMAYAALTEQSKHLQGPSDFLNLAFLALANNIGHIHAHFRCFNETAIYCDQVSHRLVSELRTSRTIGAAYSISDEDYQLFFMNACFFQKSTLASAPAA
jgi:hypothetical protein